MFKVGDKVKVIEKSRFSEYNANLEVGKITTVTDVSIEGHIRVYGNALTHMYKRFELVEPPLDLSKPLEVYSNFQKEWYPCELVTNNYYVGDSKTEIVVMYDYKNGKRIIFLHEEEVPKKLRNIKITKKHDVYVSLYRTGASKIRSTRQEDKDIIGQRKYTLEVSEGDTVDD